MENEATSVRPGGARTRFRQWGIVLGAWWLLVTVLSLPAAAERLSLPPLSSRILPWLIDTFPGFLVSPVRWDNTTLSTAFLLMWPAFAVLLVKGLKHDWGFRAGVVPVVVATLMSAASFMVLSISDIVLGGIWDLGAAKGLDVFVRGFPGLLRGICMWLAVGILANAGSALLSYAGGRGHSPNKRIQLTRKR